MISLDCNKFCFTQRAHSFHLAQVRVVTSDIAAGHTILDRGLKQWNGPNAWTGRPKVKVAIGVQSEAVVRLMRDLMSA